MIEYSTATQRSYDPDSCVFYLNQKQVAFYMDNDATLLDVFARADGKLVYVFSRDDHNRLIKIWHDRQHD